MAVSKEFRDHCIAYWTNRLNTARQSLEDAYWDGDSQRIEELNNEVKKGRETLQALEI